MYIDENSTAAEILMSKLEDLQKYNNQIELGEDAKARKQNLMEEIGELYRQLVEEGVSMEVTIKIEGLDQLTEAVALLGGAMAYFKGASAEEAADAVEAVTTKAEENLPKVEESTAKEEAAAGPSVSRDEVRALFAAKNTKDKRTQLKGILDKYGAKNISSLKEEDFEAVMKDLGAI